MIKDISSSASALYDGGWRAADREELQKEHNLTDQETEMLVLALARLEEEGQKISLDNGRTFISPAEAILQEDWDVLVHYMDDDARESVHRDLAPCGPLAFLTEYLRRASTDLIIG